MDSRPDGAPPVRQQAFSAVRWTSLAMLARAAFAFSQLVILARLLDPSDFGVMVVASAIVSTILVVADAGVSSSLLHYQDVTSNELSSLYWFNLATAGTFSLAVALGSVPVAIFYAEPRLQGVLLSISGLFLITAIGQQVRVMAEKDLRFRWLARIEVAAAFLGFLTAVGAAWLGAGVYSFPMGMLATSAATTTLSWLFVADGWRPGFRFRFSEVARFVSFGLQFVGVNLTNSVALQGDVLLSGRLLASTQLGAYAPPRDLCLRIMFVVNPIITRVGLPLMARVQEDKARVSRVYLKTLRMTASVNFPIYGALFLIAPEFVRVLFGESWLASADLLRAVAIWCLFRSVANPITSLLYALGETRRAFTSSVGVMLAVLASVWIGAQFGLIGVPIALAFLYAALVVLFWRFLVRPACGSGFVEYHAQIAVPLFATIMACAVAWVAIMPLHGSLERLTVGILVGGASYGAVSYLVNREWVDAMRELLVPVVRMLTRAR